MKFASEVGVDMRSLCGVWEAPDGPGPIDVILPGHRTPGDCGACHQVYVTVTMIGRARA